MTQMGETWAIRTDGIDQEEQEFKKRLDLGSPLSSQTLDTLRIRRILEQFMK